MTTPVCGGSKSYLVRQNVTILVKKYGYFGCLLWTKVTTVICGGSKSYLIRQNVTILVKKYGYFGWLLASDKSDNGYMWRLEILFGQAKCNYFSKEVWLFRPFASDKDDNSYMWRLEILFG